MPDYRNAATEQFNKRQNQDAENRNSLFQALMGQRNQRTLEDMGNQAKMQQMQEQEAQNTRAVDRNLGIAKDSLAQDPTYNVNLGNTGSVGLSKQKSEANPLAEVRKDNLHRMLIKDVTGDYDKRTQGLKTGMQSAQSIINALDAGDIQTLGQVKANLPRLEGERFKPTDAERALMIQPTGQGAFERLSNYFKGDNAALSGTQKKAIRQIVGQKISNAQKDMQGSQNEVMTRWGHRVNQLAPDEVSDLQASLGSSVGNVIQSIPGQSGATPPPQDPRAELEMLRAKKAAKLKGGL